MFLNAIDLRRRASRRAVSLGIVIVVTLAACGGGTSSTPTTAQEAAPLVIEQPTAAVPTAGPVPTHATRPIEPAPDSPAPPRPQAPPTGEPAAVEPDPEGPQLVACDGSSSLDVSPLAPDDYGVILPLGNLNPPGHTIPTDHIYYMLPREGEATRRVEVRAPGDIVILGIDTSAHLSDGAEQFSDYSISFAPCKDQRLKFGHLTTISPALREALDRSEQSQCNEYGVGDVTYRYCTVGVRIELDGGTVLGTAGGIVDGSAALDLWAFDLAADKPVWANPQRYPSYDELTLHVVCPLDLFSSNVKEAQAARLGGHSGEIRTVEPRCGEVSQDRPGTAQGNWYTGADTTTEVPWNQHLAMVHDNADPSIAALSIGGVVSDAGVWHFAPAADGRVNRDFADVAADGDIYCYEDLASQHEGEAGLSGRILIQLVDAETLLVEHQGETCRDPLAFETPVTYKR